MKLILDFFWLNLSTMGLMEDGPTLKFVSLKLGSEGSMQRMNIDDIFFFILYLLSYVLDFNYSSGFCQPL